MYRGSRPAAPPRTRRVVPHSVCCEYSQRTRVPPGYLGGRRRELCAACGVQAGQDGGLVGISSSGTGNVSVVDSTLTGITVRAHYGVPCEYPSTAAPVRLLRPARAAQWYLGGRRRVKALGLNRIEE